MAPMQRLARTRTLFANAVLAAAAVGLVEATGMALVGEPAGGVGLALAAWITSAVLAGLGALPPALALLLAIGVLGGARIGQEVGRDFSAGGGARAVLVWRSILAAAAIGTFAYVSFALAARTYAGYPDREPPLFGAFVASAVTGAAIVIALVTAVVERQLSHRIATAPWAARVVSGPPFKVAVAALVLATILVPQTLIQIALPDTRPIVSLGGCSLLLIAIAARTARVGARPVAQVAAAVLLAGMLAGLTLVRGSEAGRSRVTSHGLVSRTAFVALSRSRLSDRDRDTFAASFFGGADCDDSRSAHHPRATDVPGNGIDENCTGADADPAALAERSKPRPATRPGAPKLNILVVSIDAMRADHTGAYGYARPTTPTIDRLAAGGTRFAWAFTSQPTTRPALVSLLTGRHPSTLLWHRRMKLYWKESRAVGIAEVLEKAGYDTAMIACCDRFDKLENETQGFGYHDRGPIATYKATPGQANSDAVAAGAVRWLEKRGGATAPFFMWMHFIDPHQHYEVPKGSKSFGDEPMDR